MENSTQQSNAFSSFFQTCPAHARARLARQSSSTTWVFALDAPSCKGVRVVSLVAFKSACAPKDANQSAQYRRSPTQQLRWFRNPATIPQRPHKQGPTSAATACASWQRTPDREFPGSFELHFADLVVGHQAYIGHSGFEMQKWRCVRKKQSRMSRPLCCHDWNAAPKAHTP